MRTVQVYLHKRGDVAYEPEHAICQDNPEKGRVGCGRPIVFLKTFPKGARMPFDAMPRVISQYEDPDGSTIAHVDTAGVHFATCRVRGRA